tara:strand:- start:374 stop:574 length:201 start_codon:yes stop_codon:yes gene_type:complete
MNESERRYQVSLTKNEIESLVCVLLLSAGSLDSPFIERLERRLRQIQSHEEMERQLSGAPEIQVGI